MRLPLAAALVLAVSAASPARAQDADDFASRIVKEQEDLRRRQLEQVMSAPARAIDHTERDPYRPLDSATPAAAPAAAPKTPAPWRPPDPNGGFPWILVACLLPVVPLFLYAWATWRKSGMEER